LAPGTNPTTSSYNASDVKFTVQRVAFYVLKSKIFSSNLKNALYSYSAGAAAVNFDAVGLAPGTNVMIFEIFFQENWRF
jgi:hypothetical protein